MKLRYKYDGPVFKFDKPITKKWIGTTMADNEKQALGNLTYRAKMQFGFASNAALKLDAKYLKIEYV